MSGKQFVLVAASIAVGGFVVVGSWYAQHKPESQPPKAAEIKDSALAAASRQNQKDSDGDGLKDWEEELWGSNPYTADTDGDGTPDGEEVKADRDPTVAGPDDAVDSAKTKEKLATSLSENNKPITLTELFLQSAQAHLAAEQMTPERRQETKAKLQRALENASLKGPREIKVSESDIKNIIAPSKKAVRSYGNDLGLLVQEYRSLTKPRELLIAFQELASTKLSSELSNASFPETQKLDPIIADYDSLVADLRNILVPQDAVGIHAELLSLELQKRASIKQMKSIQSDPIGGIFALKQYQKAMTDSQAATKKLRSYFNSHNISYSENEPGYELLQ